MALVDKFLATPPKEFRRVVSLEPVPGNVRVHIGRMAPYGGPWNGSALEGDLPNKRHIVTHLSDKIVVVVYESVEYTGPVTSVMIFDRESFKVCNYPRWPFEQDPRRLSIAEIQDQLESGLAADRTFTACHLDTMSLDY